MKIKINDETNFKCKTLDLNEKHPFYKYIISVIKIALHYSYKYIHKKYTINILSEFYS